MRINQNISAMNTYSRLTGANNSKSRSLEKLSSGLRINRAGDDAAGLAISEKMRGQVGGLKQAVRNAQDGISLIQTAEGALNETHSILGRMRDLAVQSSSDTNTDADRAEIQKEMDQLASEMTRISNTTEFNTKNLLNGEMTKTVFHIGANSGQNIELGISAMDAFSLGVASNHDVASATGSGNVGEITFDRYVGEGVVDGAKVSLSYTAEVEAEDATAGTMTTDATFANMGAFETALGTTPTATFNIDGVAKTVTFTAAPGTYANMDAVAAHINTELGGAGTVTMAADGKLTITSASEGADSKITMVAGGLFGAGTPVNGEAAVEAESAKVTLTDADGVTQDVDVKDINAKSFKVTEGAFKGMEVALKGKISEIATDASDKFEVKVVTTEAIAALDGEDAVAPAGIDVSKQELADAAITIIDKATAMVSEERSKLGSIQNRLDHTINNLTATAENLSAAESRIRDVDMAEEMMEFTKNNILSQAATSMLAQANQMPQSVLQLLQ